MSKLEGQFGFLILVLIAGPCGGPQCGEYEEFFDLPVPEQGAALLEYPLEDQVEIYVLARTQEHPPTPLSRALASNGEPLIPVLLERLETETTNSGKVDLILVLGILSCDYYDLNYDEQVLGTVSRFVSSFEDGYWKEQAEKNEARICKRQLRR